MVKRYLLLVFLAAFVGTSCNKVNTAPAIDLQSNYYPLTIGAVYVYTVDSLAYDEFTQDSTRYQFELKDSIVGSFTDLTGATHFRIERYKKPNGTDHWMLQQVFSRSKSIRDGEEFINNQRFVKLIFPPLKNSSWNGNSKNTIGEQKYVIANGAMPTSINSLSFDSTVVVTEIDEQNLIREDLVYSTYARKVGLVKKEVTAIDKDITSGKITNGYIYTLAIKSYK